MVVCKETEPSVRSSEVLGRDEVPFLSPSFWMRLFFVTGRIASPLAMRTSIPDGVLSSKSPRFVAGMRRVVQQTIQELLLDLRSEI